MIFHTEGWRTGLIWAGIVLFGLIRWGISSGRIFVTYGEPYEVIKGNFVYTYQDPIINYGLYYSMWAIAIVLILLGCFIWTRLKNRHWGFLFWGLLTPIGLIGISLLKDKSASGGFKTQDSTQLLMSDIYISREDRDLKIPIVTGYSLVDFQDLLSCPTCRFADQEARKRGIAWCSAPQPPEIVGNRCKSWQVGELIE